MTFDLEYYKKLKTFLLGKYNETTQDLNSLKVTSNKEKLIFHLKYHIDNGNNPAVDFNSDYSKFRVYYSEDAVKKEFDPNTIDPDDWIITTKRVGYKRIMDLSVSVAEEKRAKKKAADKKKKSTNSNNNEYTNARIEY